MPRHLPGLQWDQDKQRYFPLQPHHRPYQTHIEPPVPTTPRRDPLTLNSYRALSDLRSVCRTRHKDALIHQIHSSQISLTDKTTRSAIPLQGLVSAFHTVSRNGREWRFAGDTLGWVYSSVVDTDHQESDDTDPWQRQYYLSSEVSSIALSPTTCVATSFGPESRILYIPLDSPVQGIHVSKVASRIAHDVWTSDLHGARLVLGANKQAAVIEDIAVCTSLHRLPTQSDVFALAQSENIIYTGLRNGGIIRFDTRVQASQGYPLFDSTSQRSSSVIGLKLLHDHRLLVSFIDGRISTFDLRFPVRTPSMDFTGNFNSYTNRLPVVTDPHENFLFAAGQDNRIRLWSLMTGGPPLPTAGMGSINQAAFERPFKHHVAALQVVEEKEGMCLWAASGTELCKYSLGHRSGIGI